MGSKSSVGERLARLLQESGLQQKAVAHRAGLNPEAVNRIVRGGTADPGWSTMVRLLRDGLGLSLDEFEGGVAKPSLNPYDTTPIYRELIDSLADLPREDRSEIIRHAMWLASRLRSHIVVESPKETEVRIASAGNVAAFPQRTVPRWTEEFPIEPKDFNDGGDTDFPLELHAFEQLDLDEEDLGEAGGNIADMPTKLLSSREVRSAKVRTVRVRNNDVAPYREGWKLAIDVTKRDPTLIPDRKAIVVYRPDVGTILGRIYHVGAQAMLRKDGEERGIDLADGYRIVGQVDHIAYAKDEDDSTGNAAG